MWVNDHYYHYEARNANIEAFNNELKKSFNIPTTLHYFSSEDSYYNFLVEDLFIKWLNSVSPDESPDSFLPILNKLNDIICSEGNPHIALDKILSELSNHLSPLGICLIKYYTTARRTTRGFQHATKIDDLVAEICKTYGDESNSFLLALKEQLVAREYLLHLLVSQQSDYDILLGAKKLFSFSLADSKNVLPNIGVIGDILMASLYARNSKEDYDFIESFYELFKYF